MMNGMAAMNAKMAAGFNAYAAGRHPANGYPSSGGYGGANPAYGGPNPAAYGGYGAPAEAVQTDTPPQTPPNLKMGQHPQQHQGYHPYVSPQHHQHHQRMLQHHSQQLPSSQEQHQSGEMLSPGSSRAGQMMSGIMAAPQQPSSTSSTDSGSTAFRPVYRT